MCEIPERDPAVPENVLHLARDGRKLLNWESLCNSDVLTRYNVDTKCFEGLDFCGQVRAMYWADIIIASHGSGLAMTAFARQGSVVIGIFILV